MPRIALPAVLLSLLLAACASTPPPAPEPPAPADPPPAPEALADLYARHLVEVVEQDIALGRLVVRMGDSLDAASSGRDLLLREEAFTRFAEEVARAREERLRIADFWDRVKTQWPEMATAEDRAALAVLDALPSRD